MNTQQKNLTITQIEEFKKIKLEEIFALAYPNQTDLPNIQISRMKIGEFTSLSKRIFQQLEKEINSENGLILPYHFTTQEFGSSTIDAMLGSYLSQVKGKNFPNAENYLMWLSHYELQNGFYDKSKTKFHSIEILEINKAKDEFNLISENYKQLKNQYDSLLKELNNQKKQISDFQTQKQNELQQITNNLTTTNTNNTQIQTLLNQSTQAQTKINSILDQSEKDKKKQDLANTAIENTYNQFHKDFNLLLETIKTTENNYEKIYADFDKKLKFVESKHSYFSDRNEYLDNLIGREVGASLFETFKQRKIELEKPLFWWKIAVGIMSGLTFFIVLAIFTNLFGRFGPIEPTLHWQNILVNALKTLPFFFLLYYAIAQYNKERTFQEEYAFKSAAALTIKAYADILKDDKNKDELILKAVSGIYRSPIYSKLKTTKEVNSTLDMVSDLLKKGSDFLIRKP